MYNLDNVASWWVTVTDKNETVFDNIFISYRNNNVIAFLPFKRSKSYSYSEIQNEYNTTHAKNLQFLNLLLKLKGKKQHIVNKAA